MTLKKKHKLEDHWNCQFLKNLRFGLKKFKGDYRNSFEIEENEEIIKHVLFIVKEHDKKMKELRSR